MSSSQGGGTPLPNYYPVPKYVVLLSHGWNGSENSLIGITNKVDNVTTFALDFVGHGAQEISDMGIPLKNKEISLWSENKTLENKILFIRTKFSNGFDYVDNQARELLTIVDHLRFIYQDRVKIVLVGHSKGGLVGIDFATRFNGKIHGLISISTPYRYSILPMGVSLDGTLGSADEMNAVRTNWNALQSKPKAFALGCKIYPIFIPGLDGGPGTWAYNDGLIIFESQMATGYSGITKFQLADLWDVGFSHTSVCDQQRTYDKVLEYINQI